MYLQIENLKKFYGQDENKVEVLRGINCGIEKSEICVMLGPSGSGKSTLLNLIGGIETIDEGDIVVGDVDLGKLSNKDLTLYRRNTLGLEEHQNKYPNQLSGGQQQRTAIGRALAKNPSLLLCDEPTGALDYKTSKDILELLEKINEKYKTTIIVVTHNDAIKNMAHRVMRLRDGQIIKNKINETRTKAEDLEW